MISNISKNSMKMKSLSIGNYERCLGLSDIKLNKTWNQIAFFVLGTYVETSLQMQHLKNKRNYYITGFSIALGKHYPISLFILQMQTNGMILLISIKSEIFVM